MNVVYALFNGVVCNDTATVHDIGIEPFSTLYVCSDLYELIITLPDRSTITLYKHYYTTFYSIVQEIAVRVLYIPFILATMQHRPRHVVNHAPVSIREGQVTLLLHRPDLQALRHVDGLHPGILHSACSFRE